MLEGAEHEEAREAEADRDGTRVDLVLVVHARVLDGQEGKEAQRRRLRQDGGHAWWNAAGMNEMRESHNRKQ